MPGTSENGALRDKKPPSLIDPQSIVQIHVHPPQGESQTFPVYKDFICYHSSFFDAAFNGKFVEGETQQLDLQDTVVDVFGIFVGWLYHQCLINREGGIPSCANLLDLWLLADRILAPKLQNQAIRRLEGARLFEKRLPSYKFERVYQNTCADSPLRRYIVRTWNYRTISKNRSINYPRDLLLDLVNAKATKERRAASRLQLEGDDLEVFYVPEHAEKRPEDRSLRSQDAAHDTLESVEIRAESPEIAVIPKDYEVAVHREAEYERSGIASDDSDS